MDFEHLMDDAENGLVEDKLTQIAQLAAFQLKYEEQLAMLEAQAKEVKAKLLKISQEELPQLILGTGVSRVRLADGKEISVTQELSASVKDMRAFSKFVAERGDDAILKTTIELGKLPDNVIKAIQKWFADTLNMMPDINRTVHAQTLKKYVKELCGVGMEGAEERLGDRYIPLGQLPDYISAFTYYKTKIKG